MDHYDGKLYGIYVGLWVPSILGGLRVIETEEKKMGLIDFFNDPNSVIFGCGIGVSGF